MTTVPTAATPARRRPGLSVAGLPQRAWRSPLAFDAAFAMVMALVTVLGSLAESHPPAASSRRASMCRWRRRPPACWWRSARWY